MKPSQVFLIPSPPLASVIRTISLCHAVKAQSAKTVHHVHTMLLCPLHTQLIGFFPLSSHAVKKPFSKQSLQQQGSFVMKLSNPEVYYYFPTRQCLFLNCKLLEELVSYFCLYTPEPRVFCRVGNQQRISVKSMNI